MDRNALLLKLSEVEFAAIDMQLYLDTHPCDRKAISKYNEFVMQAKMLREEYEKNHGPLMSYISPSDENKFTWIDEPWPWEREFNTRV